MIHLSSLCIITFESRVCPAPGFDWNKTLVFLMLIGSPSARATAANLSTFPEFPQMCEKSKPNHQRTERHTESLPCRTCPDALKQFYFKQNNYRRIIFRNQLTHLPNYRQNQNYEEA